MRTATKQHLNEVRRLITAELHEIVELQKLVGGVGLIPVEKRLDNIRLRIGALLNRLSNLTTLG